MTEIDLHGADALFRLRPAAGLDDRTWRDLAMDAVFVRIDRCRSAMGRQMLYGRLRTPQFSLEPLLAFERRVEALARDPALRLRLTQVLATLGDAGTQSLAHIIYGPPPTLPRRAAFFPLATLATLIALAVSAVQPVALLFALACIVMNIAIRVLVFRELDSHIEGARQVAKLVSASKQMAQLDAPDLEALREATKDMRSHRLTLAWLGLDRLRLGEIPAMIVEYVNVFLLLDVNAYVREVRRTRTRRPALATMFESLGEIDAAMSVAEWRAELVESARPSIEGDSFELRGLRHPLVDDAVPNDVDLRERGYLVTGSNMAGKSTYLKAVALQAVLAQTVFTSTSRSYRAPFVRVQTLLEVKDDVLSARSHFRVEAETALAMLEASKAERCLCIVDELFRGTNTNDRVAAGAACLRAIHRTGAFVLAATHDHELLDLLDAELAPHYFSERIDESGLAFDYRLQPGPAAPRNALAVLALVGFPADVLEDASVGFP